MSGRSSPPTDVMSRALAIPLLSIQGDVYAGADELERVFTDECAVFSLTLVEAEYTKVAIFFSFTDELNSGGSSFERPSV